MNFAYYIKKESLKKDLRVASLLDKISQTGHSVYDIALGVQQGTDMLLSFGGDGTFLTAADYVSELGVPVLGINLGRLGFLSGYTLDQVLEPLLSGSYHIEKRSMLQIGIEGSCPQGFSPYALNEVAVRRISSETLGVDVKVGSQQLPTYWADGLLVSTPSGSTAYSLSAGGPVCTPQLRASLIVPISPHNLNLRPLIVPDTEIIEIGVQAGRKNSKVCLSLDNREYPLSADSRVIVRRAPFDLQRVVLGESDFIGALRSKLFWGQDVRNSK